MLTPLRLTFAGALLVLAVSQHAGAGPIPDAAQVSFEVAMNSVDGISRIVCEKPEQENILAKQEWHVAFAEVKAHPRKGWEAVDSRLRCGIESLEKKRADSGSPSRNSFLTSSISTTVRSRRGPLGQTVLEVEVSISLQKLSGLSREGGPRYRHSEERRVFYFFDNRKVFVPLFVADEIERKELGVHEILLKATARIAGWDSNRSFGVILATSGAEEGELLLDGGGAGRVSAGTETVLRNIPAGLREVRVRDSEGREAVQVVRVQENRTVLVDLDPAELNQDETPYRLEPLGKNDQGYDEYRRLRDGAVVVRIPAGEFLMGNRETERAPLEHPVYVSEFLMDRTGVTWSRFKRYAASTGAPLPPRDPYWGIHDDHPVVYVTWEEAKRYCEWAGGRLPTEAEREKAARGTDGRKYPWGDEEPDPQRGVHRRSWGQEATAAVGTHPAGVSPYGLHDMGGNVWEWCSDWYDDDYFAVSPYRDPMGPSTGSAHVVRGGSWDSRPTVLSASCRNWGHRGYREGDFGFRCAMNPAK